MIEIQLILFLMIVAALIAVNVKDLLSSVVAIGAVGIGLSMAFLVLKAPDLAMMQLVVEILSLIILIHATIKKDIPFSTSGRWVFNTAVTVLFLITFLTASFITMKMLPGLGSPIMGVSRNYLGNFTGTFNIVSSIAMRYRLLDTLGEVAVIFTVIVGILAVARRVGHERAD